MNLFTIKSLRRIASKVSSNWIGPGGLTIAFVGADGSGKTSTVKNISKWLSWKLSIETAYMGIPKRKLIWKFFNQILRVTEKFQWSVIVNQLNAIRWTWLAWHRYRLFIQMEKIKNQGKIVIYDRFPLKEFWQMEQPMDGPRLKKNGFWFNLERQYYEKINNPDYIFILSVELSEYSKRKKEDVDAIFIKQLKSKINAVNQLIREQQNGRIVIDTMNGRDKTLSVIKNEIWKFI